MKEEINISDIKNVYFIGIGGIGMSALALYLKHLGKNVVGSDTGFASYENLVETGIDVHKDYDSTRITSSYDVVVYTLATPKDNEELLKAGELGLPIFTYAEMLGLVSKNKKTIAISGTHGKTTTTAMVAKVLIDAGLSPTVIVGSLLNYPFGQSEKKTNFIAGDSEYFVVEACEYKRIIFKFISIYFGNNKYRSHHLDYYKDLSDIQEAFKELSDKVPKDRSIITSAEYDKYIQSVPPLMKPGEHNRKDAAAAYAVAKKLGIPEEVIKKSLADFPGTWRRFEYRGKTQIGALIYDDYGHHPTEIKATLEGARELFGDKKIIAVF